MKTRVGILLFIFFALLGWAYSASASSDLFRKAAGHYEGTLTSNEKGQYARVSVKTDLDLDSGKGRLKALTIKSEEGTDLLVVEFNKINKKDFIIGGPFVDTTVKLKKDEGDDCFTESTNRIDFCFFRDGITIEINNAETEYAVTLNRFAKEKPIPLESPKVYDLQSALNQAWNFNFDNRIEFEHVIQAKYGAKAAKRLLVPHISFQTIVNNVKPTILSVIGAAGDLLPFLFPTRWLQAKHAAILSQAEQDGMTLMRLDTATQIEAQFYALENYRQLKKSYDYIEAKADRLLEIVNIKVKAGLVKKVASKDFFTVTGQMKDDGNWIGDQYEAQKIAIAQNLGLYNMQGVQDAVIGTEVMPITKAQPLDAISLTKTVEERSIELKQLQFFTDAAKNNTNQVKWNWLDPTGDPTLGLGWSLKSSIDVADSMAREASLRKQEMQRTLGDQAAAAVNDYNTALRDYPLISKLTETQVERLDEYEQELKGSGVEDTDRAINLLQDYIAIAIRLQFNLNTFRTARARVDRLLLQGFYEKGTLPPKINRNPQ